MDGDTVVVRNLSKRNSGHNSYHSIEAHRYMDSYDQPGAPKQHIPNKVVIARTQQ